MKLERVSRAYLLGLPSLPGICPDEELLIRDWLRSRGATYDSFSVNVRAPLPPRGQVGSLTNIDRMWLGVTRPRIDLVAWLKFGAFVIEAKWFARFTAVTQVLRYTEAFRLAFPNRFPVRPVILCRAAALGVAGRMIDAGGDCWLEPPRAWAADDRS